MAIRAESQIDLSRVDDGAQGADGTTFTPSVDSSGNISWTNDGGKPNPPTQNIMGPSSQYFWYETSGADAGAHITEVPQEEWQDPSDPNYQSGGNVLAKTNEIAVRDGMTNLATFGASGVNIGNNAGGHTIINADGMRIYGGDGTTQIANLGYGEGQAGEGSGTSLQPYFSFGTRYGESVVASRGNYSMTVGNNNEASGKSSFAGGSNEVIGGDSSFAYGSNNTIYRKNGVLGYQALASAAFGLWNRLTKTAQFVIGIANEEDTNNNEVEYGSASINIGKYAFIIGNGTFNNTPGTIVKERSNAFTVGWDGSVTAAGALTMENHATPVGWYNTISNTVSKATGTSFASISGSAYTPPLGRWLITASARYSGASSGNRGVCIYQGGAVSDSTQVLVPAIQSSSWATNLKTMGYFNADGSTEFRIGLLQNSGSSLSTTYSLTFIRIR